MARTTVKVKRGGVVKVYEIHTPILKFLIWVALITLFIVTLPLAILLWLTGFKGFFHDNEWSIDRKAFTRR